MRRMNGSMANADLLMSASDKSACAPDPRRSTRPGFGVSSASAISACLARAPSNVQESIAIGSTTGCQRVLVDGRAAGGGPSSASQARQRSRGGGPFGLASEATLQRWRRLCVHSCPFVVRFHLPALEAGWRGVKAAGPGHEVFHTSCG